MSCNGRSSSISSIQKRLEGLVPKNQSIKTLDALVPVTIVQLEEPVIFTCILTKSTGTKSDLLVQAESWGQSGHDSHHWKSTKISVWSKFPASRFQINENEDFCNLMILEAIAGEEMWATSSSGGAPAICYLKVTTFLFVFFCVFNEKVDFLQLLFMPSFHVFIQYFSS